MKNTILRCGKLLLSFLLAASFPPFSFSQGDWGRTQTQSAAAPALDRIREEHQRVLNELNVKDGEGKGINLDDPREWDGREAKPLLVEKYNFSYDEGEFHFDGRTVRITTKEEVRTLYSCGGCPDPRGIWKIRITSVGVKDLGHRFEKPELKWADSLLTKLENREDVKDLASPGVVKVLNAGIAKLQSEAEVLEGHPVDYRVSWGMLDRCRILRRGQSGAFVITTDDVKLRFRYVLRHGKPYFTSVVIH